MKILLIQPPKSPRTIAGDDIHIYEPLALEYLASGIGQDHDVKILDMRLEKSFEQTLAEFKPDIVGITGYTVHVNIVKRLFEEVKTWDARTLTVVGGHHATVMPGDFLSPFIDIIVLGEGVFPFKEIVQRLEKGESFEGVAGTAIARGDTLITTKCDPRIDLDSLPFPDRKLTAKYRGRYFSEWLKPLASIRTSKGCPYRCNFCAEWKVAGGHYYKRKPERVVEELEEIPEDCVFFADDESLVDAARMSLLARLIKEAGIKKRYFLYGRSDTIARNPQLVEAWRDIGLERIFIGLEFCRDEDLIYIRKGSTADDNEKAVRILQGLGIDVYASFIVRPDFTRSDFDALRHFCRRMDLDYAGFAVLTPLPGTDLYQELREKLITHEYDLFDFIHTVLPTALPLKEFYSEYLRLYKKGTTFSSQLGLLRKFPLREIPGAISKGLRFYSRLKTTHLDYAS